MTLVERLFALPELAECPALLIGGHAVNALGRIRATLDWDFMICRTELPRWRKALESMGFTLFSEADAFVQFKEPADLPPVDLMLVNEATFEKMFAASIRIQVGTIEVRVPCPQHLVALKLHAAASEYRGERSKDLEDIYAIVRRHKLSVDDPAFRELVERYGGAAAVRLIKSHELGDSVE